MSLRKIIEQHASAVSSFDHWHDSGDKAQATEAAKKAVALQDRIDVLIAQAEAAERVANAVERWRCQSHAANWQAVVNCLHGYDVAKEAVRSMEEGT